MKKGERERPEMRHVRGERNGRRRGHGTGFTLVELLIVVAVISVVAAILLPVFAQARDRARQSTCVNNLTQIVRAGMLYLQDYDERFPSCYWSAAPPYAIDPRTLLQPYLRNWGAWYCPARRTARRGCLDPAAGFRPNARCMGYGYNWGSGLTWESPSVKGDGLVRFVVPDQGRAFVEGVTLAEVAVPAHCFFYGDTNDDQFITLLREAMPGVRSDRADAAGTNPLGRPYEPPRHQEGNNFVFVDGHVQWLPFPGGHWIDGGPWVVPDMSMYSRTGYWESGPVP